MKKLLLAAALGAGLLGSAAPANACAFRQCTWGILICSTVNCPRYCYYVAAAHKTVCVIN